MEHAKIRPLQITREPVRLIIASDWYTFQAHWEGGGQKPRECAGQGCLLCRTVSPPHVRHYSVGELATGELRLLCLRKRHSELVHHLRVSRVEGVGHELEVYKTGPAPNSPIRADLIGEWDVDQIEADAFMSTVLQEPLTSKRPTLRETDSIKGSREAAT